MWCVVGDFKSVRRKEERKSVVLVSDYKIIVEGLGGLMVSLKRLSCWIFQWLEESSLGTSRMGPLRAKLTGSLFSRNGWMSGQIVNNWFSADRSLIIVL